MVKVKEERQPIAMILMGSATNVKQGFDDKEIKTHQQQGIEKCWIVHYLKNTWDECRVSKNDSTDDDRGKGNKNNYYKNNFFFIIFVFEIFFYFYGS